MIQGFVFLHKPPGWEVDGGMDVGRYASRQSHLFSSHAVYPQESLWPVTNVYCQVSSTALFFLCSKSHALGGTCFCCCWGAEGAFLGAVLSFPLRWFLCCSSVPRSLPWSHLWHWFGLLSLLDFSPLPLPNPCWPFHGHFACPSPSRLSA